MRRRVYAIATLDVRCCARGSPDDGPTSRAMYRKILFPHDGSEVADCAVPHLVTLASIAGAEVVLLHVVESEATAGREPTLRLADGVVGNERLDALRERLRAEGVESVSTLIVDGDAPEAIAHTAAELGCDLIVMATRARTGLPRALAGSVAEAALRHTRGVPVMLVPHTEHSDG
ncbi:MAG: universal stress protein [Dehalococcoidia bacterium]|nr:universal stress protein [Dehalococcoidia bacterium]